MLWNAKSLASVSSRLPTRLPRPLQALAHQALVTEDGPRSSTRAGPRRSRRPRHPRAISSGHERMQRSIPVTPDDRCAGLRLPDLGWGGGRNCMAGKGSGPVMEAQVLDGICQR